MIPDIIELNFPKKDGKQYVTLTHATVNVADMGEKTISTQVRIDGDIVPDFSQDWAVEFQGEKYIMPLRIPQGSKGNDSLKSEIDLTFQHWAIYQLKRWPFVAIQQIAAGTYLPDEEVATVQLNLKDFCILFGQVLQYYYGDAITIDLNPAWQYKHEAIVITISHTKIWNVLIDTFHNKYGVRWEIKATSDNSNTVKGSERYVIRVGYPTTEVDHIFEYGFEGGLLKVERQVQSEEIRNMLKGRGGDTNIPFRYFKDTDPNNKDFRPDPDWVEELANIYFPNLMPATFRSYVQGWKAAHISKYPGYTAVGENNAYAPWAYSKGATDTKFAPVEFVADEITINPTTGDKQVEILPGYSPYVKKGSSLDKYGPLPDTLDNNDDIYPTLQGTGLDIAVDVEQIKSDDVAESTESDAQLNKIPNGNSKTTIRKVEKSAYATGTIPRVYFTVPAGKTANLTDDCRILSVVIPSPGGGAGTRPRPQDIATSAELVSKTVNVYSQATGEKRSASGIPAGDYYFEIVVEVHNLTTDKTLDITVGTETPSLEYATLDDRWRNTFDIWVKNIWDSAKLPTETASQYAERVWKPVLGDREGNTAKVVFTSGALAVSEDYEFTIVDFPVPDSSKSYEGEQSHWRITLAKSEAELEATGRYVPSTQKQGKAGDTFVFIGTEMTHVPYVVDAEIRLDDWKKDQLGEKKEVKPTAVVTTDRVRLNNEGKPDALINQLRVGNSLRLFDKRFFNEEGKTYETLYLQSITYTYREPSSDDAALNPDVEIVLGNEYTTSANPVSMMQGEISALQKQVGSISNIEQIVRAVDDRLYLRKDGISDRSLSPTQFFSLLTSGDFRAGLVGGAGWGFYKDENGNWVLEADRLKARQDLEVNTLVINQAEGRGGMEIDTAAFMEVTRVVETDNSYICYFDQKEGTVANLFHTDDVAYCQRWTPENTDLKFYKRRVTAVGVDNITLSKTDVNGTGIPAEGDNIIHYGNYTDKTRQYIKVRDVIGGGYERYIEELDSVNAEGVEYYFVGKQTGQSRWFVGNKDLVPYSGDGNGSYIEYLNKKFNLNNVALSVGSTVGGVTFGDLFKNVSGLEYIKAALGEYSTTVGGLFLTSIISLGTGATDSRTTMAGMNGVVLPEKNGRDIALWFGGDMLDMEDYYDWDNDQRKWVLKAGADITGLRIAKGIDRMDGTGYRAGGNLWWDADGNVHADPLSFFVGENTVGNVLSLFKYFPTNTTPFTQTTAVEPQRIFTRLRIGSEDGTEAVELTYKDGSLYVDGNIVAAGGVAALSQGDYVPGGGGTGGGLDLAALEAYLKQNNYATQGWVNSRGFLLQHQAIYALTVKKNGTAVGSYTPNSAAAEIDITDVASAATLAAHTGDNAIHITAAERTKWNAAAADLSAIMGSNSNKVLDKWEEIKAFLATYTEADTLANLLGNKADKTVAITAGTGLSGGGTLAASRTLSLAQSGVTAGTYTKVTVDVYGRVTAGAALSAADIPALGWSKITTGKPTTIAGYGITDAYTKTEADGKYVTSLDVSGDYVRYIINGTAHNITVPYATESLRFQSAIINTGDDLNSFITSGLHHTTQAAVCKSLLNGPSGRSDGELWLETRNVGASGYGSQFLFTRDGINFEYWVRTFNAANAFSAWQKLLTDANYSSILDTRYYTESEIDSKFRESIRFYVATGYVAARFNNTAIAQKAADTYIEWWQNTTGSQWFNFALGKLTAHGDVTVDGAINLGSGSIRWDAARQAFIFSHTVVSEGGVAALNQGDAISGGGSGSGGLDLAALEAYLKQNGYATQAWVQSRGYLTSISKAMVESVLTGNITSHTHSQYLTQHQSLANYVNLDGEQNIRGIKTITTNLDFNSGNDAIIRMYLKQNGGQAAGVWHFDSTGAIGGFGIYTSMNNGVATPNWNFIGWGKNPYNKSNCLAVWENIFTYKGYNILHAGNYASILDGRYALATSLNGYAKLASPNNLVHAGNEITMIPDGFSSDLWLNYRAGLSGSGTIGSYNIGNGHGGYAGVVASSFRVSGGTASQFLMANGTLKALSDITSAYISSLSTYDKYLRYTKNGQTGDITIPYAVYSDSLFVTDTRNDNQAFTGLTRRLRVDFKYSSVVSLPYTPGGSSYAAVMSVKPWSDYSGGLAHQIGFNYDGELYHRVLNTDDTFGAWRKLIDSVNYASILDTRYVTIGTPQDIMGKKNFTSGLKVSGRVQSSGDDEGIVIGRASNNYAALTLGDPSGLRSTFYLLNTDEAVWRYHDGTTGFNIAHPKKTGTIALTSDLTPYLRSFFTARPGYDCNTHNEYSLASFTYGNNAPFTGAFIDVNASGYGFYLGTGYNANGALYYRRHGRENDGGMGAWQQLARITDNVASATKLADNAAYTAWGQTYFVNGKPKSISGDMTGVGSITATGDYQTTKAEAAVKVNNGSSILGLYNSTNRGVYDFSTNRWLVATNGTNSWLAAGNVGIGTTSPAYKLDVNGNARFATTVNIGDVCKIGHIGNYLELMSGGNEMVVSGSATSLYFNHRGSGYTGVIPTTWIFNAGTPTTYANFVLGDITSHGNIVADGKATVAELHIGGGTITWDASTQAFLFSHSVVSDGGVAALKQD